MNMVGLNVANVSALGPSTASKSSSSSFGALLDGAVRQLEMSQAQANQQITGAMTGQVSVTQAMVAVSEAQSALDVATAVRNNVVQAYQTIMNMSV
ncbi:MAG: flagellar hook-basal body complex protein FliE [Sulfobacillus thermosulfidooxidans]|nr:MAG: flagellar hook-basal body complex protein FliE [Sulfobacillus thermosulfidooxidans]